MQIIFSFDTPYGTFTDALHLPDNHGLSDAEIDLMKQQRLDAWVLEVHTIPDEVKAEMEAMRFLTVLPESED